MSQPPNSNGPVRSYEDLLVWHRSLELAEQVYRASSAFPRDEVYGLTSQMRRAAVSVVSNIAEGHERHSRGEFLQFLGHARGSLAQLDTQTRLATRLNLMTQAAATQLAEKIAEVGRMLNALRKSLMSKDAARSDSSPQPPAPSP